MTETKPISASQIRIIPRIDIKGPNVVKGICFDGQRALGRPEDFAEVYSASGADELILYDTFASLLQRPPGLEMISAVAERISIPLTVAGGIRTLEDIRSVLRAGADKVAINTAAVHDPDLLRQAVEIFGGQCIVASVEYYRQADGRREIWTEYGREVHAIDALDWIDTVVAKGVGEVMITSIDRDGLGTGMDTDFIRIVSQRVPVPVIASGGLGKVSHFVEAAQAGGDALAVASAFHYALAQPFDSRYLQWTEKTLRVGAPVDAGNIDFLNEGYRGFHEVPVEACALADVKAELAKAGFGTRKAMTAEGA